MLGRLWRSIRAFFGRLIGFTEDPLAILEQNIRDMHDKIPEINKSMASAKGGIIKLEREQADYNKRIAKLTSMIKTCLTNNKREMAATYAINMKREQDGLERNKEQLDAASKSYDHLLKVRERYQLQIKKMGDEVKSAKRDARSADIESQIADAFESFEVGGADSTHDEMLLKLNDQNAEKSAKLAVAGESITMKEMEMEEQAAEMEGMDLLAQFEMELGMGQKESAPAAQSAEAGKEKSIGPVAEKDPV